MEQATAKTALRRSKPFAGFATTQKVSTQRWSASDALAAFFWKTDNFTH
jgi:hypothetical protein